MTSEVMERAFEAFFSTKGSQGTGLGLAVVRQIVERHQGTIDLQSQVGEGTVFTLGFPGARRTKRPVNSERIQFGLEGSSENKGKRILLVEDEPAVIAFLNRALTKKGYEVVPAGNCSEAIEQFEKGGHFDLLFTDSRLPDGTGIDVIDHVWSRNAGMGVLLSSGYTDARAMVEQAAGKGVRFLQKPYPLGELYEAVSDSLSGSPGEVELPR